MTHRPDGPPRVLVVDGTGRGHALCRLFTRTDPDVTVYYGPGCDVVQEDRIVVADSIRVTEPETVLSFLDAHPVDFVFVSHIDGLSIGLVDALRAAGHRTIGPTREAALLEASKERGKRFCTDHGIPTAPYRAFTEPAAARAYIETLPYACVVKTDGLTPDGDGSVVCSSAEEALRAVDDFAEESGADFHVVVEQRLSGEEVSVFALLDGGVRWFELGNQPALWSSTHADVHPLPATYGEIRARLAESAAVVKALDPQARTLRANVIRTLKGFHPLLLRALRRGLVLDVVEIGLRKRHGGEHTHRIATVKGNIANSP